MKTSTKNAIITGVCSVAAAIIGLFSGSTIQNMAIELTITQSGVISTEDSENSGDILERLLEDYTTLQSDYNDANIEFANLKSEYDDLLNEKKELTSKINDLMAENKSLNNKLEVLNAIENDETPTISPDKYLFDEEPYMEDNVYLYMRNNNRNTIYQVGGFYYETGFRMVSNGINYEKGMSITPKSNDQAVIYYNLRGQYSMLSGSIAFEDKNSDRVDKSYNIYFYCDDNYKERITITKGSLPVEFNIDITNCQILKIMLERPEGDKSDDPNINLIEFKLYE